MKINIKICISQIENFARNLHKINDFINVDKNKNIIIIVSINIKMKEIKILDFNLK
mgnify:CR=1 FL=1